jgi:hypothetical protein
VYFFWGNRRKKRVKMTLEAADCHKSNSRRRSGVIRRFDLMDEPLEIL